MKRMILATLTAAALIGCEDPNVGYAGLPHAHSYTPRETDRKAYEFVSTHKCGESRHPAGMTWDDDKKAPIAKGAFDVYYCEDVDGLIFVHEAE